MNSIKCRLCKREFSAMEILQEHLQSCKKKIIKVGAGITPFYSEPEASGRTYECKKCGAHYGSKEVMLNHRNDCI